MFNLASKYDPGSDGHCGAMIYIRSKTPTWKILPCNNAIAFEWICKRQLRTNAFFYHNKYPSYICCAKCISIRKSCFRPLPSFPLHRCDISNFNDASYSFLVATIQSMLASATENYMYPGNFNKSYTVADRNATSAQTNSLPNTVCTSGLSSIKTPSCMPNMERCYDDDTCRAPHFLCTKGLLPDSKVHGANMGPTWVLSATDGPHVGPMNLAIRVCSSKACTCTLNGTVSPDSFHCATKCQLNTCKCSPLRFQCSTIGCIPYDYVCNGKPDCNDSSDEFCNSDKTELAVSQKLEIAKFDNFYNLNRFKRCLGFKCHSSVCINIELVNDLIPDCAEAEDEPHGLNIKYHGSAYHCKSSGAIPCAPHHSKCFEIHQLCVYDHDEQGNIAYCRDGAHLFNCELITCTNAYKCPNSFCLPLRKVCDGIPDCPAGEDEINCENNVCPSYLKCTTVEFCLHPSEVCDGFPQCPNGDDEMMCDIRICPTECHCLGRSAICRGDSLSYVPVILTEKMVYLSVGFTQMNVPNFVNLTYLAELRILDLSHSLIFDICSSFRSRYNFYKSLLVIDMKYNNIRYLTEKCFAELGSLVSINLKGNPLEGIVDDAFKDVVLHSLTLSYTKMHVLSRYWLLGFSKLRTLDIRGVSLSYISISSNKVLDTLDSVRTDDRRLLCILQNSHVADNRSVQIKCPRILPHTSIGPILLFKGTSMLLFNVISALVNAKHNRRIKPIHYLLNCGLIVGGILEGFYVAVIASADIISGYHYILMNSSWENGSLCSTASEILYIGQVLSTIASIMMNHAVYHAITSIVFDADKYHKLLKKTLFASVSFVVATFSLLTFFQYALLFPSRDIGRLCIFLGNKLTWKNWTTLVPTLLLVIIMVIAFIHTLYTNLIVIKHVYSSGRHLRQLSSQDLGNHAKTVCSVSRSMFKSTVLRILECLPIPFLVIMQLGGHQFSQTMTLSAILTTIAVGGVCNVFASVWSPFIASKRRKWDNNVSALTPKKCKIEQPL